MKKPFTDISAPNKEWFRKNWSTLALIGVFILGLGIFLYPSIADYWNSFHQSRAIMSYTEAVSKLSEQDYQQELEKAYQYNRKLAAEGISWKSDDSRLDEYNSLLNITGNGIMGYLQIDKIKAIVPIYHTVEESVLQIGVGHLENTSLPVGCESYDPKENKVTDPADGSHCAMSGHRGLPSAKLLSDLDKMVEGDVFYLNVLGETFTYEVDQIRVVLPSDVQELALVPGEDYCTLITCTPYGINTHRLLVRGRRVNNPSGEQSVVADATVIDSAYVAPFIAAPIILIAVLVVIFKKPKGKGEVN